MILNALCRDANIEKEKSKNFGIYNCRKPKCLEIKKKKKKKNKKKKNVK